jgi:predicted 3-demethylubiquinone-9 3-methyltransferase (glyoxalase superfamily)
MTTMQKISPFLWFEAEAEEAAGFYVSLFEDSEVTEIARYPEGAPGPTGEVMTVSFRLAGQGFMALNGGPQYTFSQAISFYVHCDDQAEVDRLWDRLADGGEPQQCGWIVDRFGVTWQIVPDALNGFLSDPDPGRAQRAMQAMLQMVKIDVGELQRAADGV